MVKPILSCFFFLLSLYSIDMRTFAVCVLVCWYLYNIEKQPTKNNIVNIINDL